MTSRWAPRVLTIAGSDCSGGAGIQADLKTFTALGAYGMSVVTALTAQNTKGVSAIQPVPADFIGEQLQAICEDIPVDAVKIGMLHRAEVIETVAKYLRRYALSNIVLDPVFAAKNGEGLLNVDALQTLQKELFPLVTVLTPNLDEAGILLRKKIVYRQEMEEAGRQLLAMGVPAVVVKGGHIPGPSCADCLCWQETDVRQQPKVWWFEGPRLNTRNTHGTGCTFSSAVAVFLGRGQQVAEAVDNAKKFTAAAIAAGAEYQLAFAQEPTGHGPLLHFSASVSRDIDF